MDTKKDGTEKPHQETAENQLYYTVLQNLAERFDSALDTIRTAYNDQHINSFFASLALAPFRNIVHLFKAAKLKGLYTVIVALGGIYVASTIEAVEQYVMTHKLSTGIILFLSYYVIGVVLHFLNMAKIDRKKDFHIVAFKILRKAEYQLFEPFIKQKTIVDLKTLVEWVFKGQGTDQIHMELAEVRKERDTYKDSAAELYLELSDAINKMTALTHKHDQRLKYLYALLEGMSRNIARISNERFDTRALSFLAPYTIYKLEGDLLTFVDEDRTSGNSPMEIDITDPVFQEYAAVKAIKSPLCFAQTNAGPLENRKIASFFIKLANGHRYVVNFHFDSDNLFFIEDETRSIIYLRSVYEIVEAHCMLMDKHVSKRFGKRKEEQG